MMQMLGALAEFERALIRERTKSCIAAAVARGAMPGNPKMRARDTVAIALMKANLADTTLQRTPAAAKGWWRCPPLSTAARLEQPPHIVGTVQRIDAINVALSGVV